MNTLYYGDNLDILRRYIKNESVDLIYLDPPFNSNATYNVLFKEHNGAEAAAQIKAFGDTWGWDESAANSYRETVEAGGVVAKALRAFQDLLGTSNMMAYLAMMAPRLVELRRVLKPTGSIYLHCDPTASHYLKVLMDAVFGTANYTNEISWKRTTTKSDFRQGALNWPRIRDVLLHYRRDINGGGVFHQSFTPYSEEYLAAFYRHKDPDGRIYTLDKLTAPGSGTRGHPQYELLGVIRYWVYGRDKMQQLLEQGRIIQTKPGTVPRYKRYLDEVSGVAIGDTWSDIPPISSQAKERLGYPTQKPMALLERIIQASSNPGDVVMDPFCGCGTAVIAAQKLDRQWIGIDITHLAINLIKNRLLDPYGLVPVSKGHPDGQYKVIGEPTTEEDALELAESDPFQFQSWALGLVGARPVEPKKGADKGVDGRLYFHDEAGTKTKQVIFSVKAGGNVHASFIRDLRGVLEREGAEIGVFITMTEPTQEMRREAATGGFYDSAWGHHPRLQILTIGELLEGKGVNMPPISQVNVTFKREGKGERGRGEQRELM